MDDMVEQTGHGEAGVSPPAALEEGDICGRALRIAAHCHPAAAGAGGVVTAVSGDHRGLSRERRWVAAGGAVTLQRAPVPAAAEATGRVALRRHRALGPGTKLRGTAEHASRKHRGAALLPKGVGAELLRPC